MTRDVRNLQMTVAGLAVLLVLGGAAWFGLGPARSPVAEGEPLRRGPAQSVATPEMIIVHVSGAVASAGVVSVPVDARVSDAVGAAGGASPDADLSRLNLAAALRDGEQVVVPSRIAEPMASSGATTGSVGIDLNTATATELETLAGVGPVLALRIVAYRDEHGGFHEVEDLLDVPGIGEAKLSGMRDGIAAP